MLHSKIGKMVILRYYDYTVNYDINLVFDLTYSLYDLANVVPTLAKFYHQASESYEQACTRHISVIIYYVSKLNLLLFKLKLKFFYF